MLAFQLLVVILLVMCSIGVLCV